MKFCGKPCSVVHVVSTSFCSGAEGSHARPWHTLQALKSKAIRVLYNDGFLKHNFRCEQKS
jgi:hypothetical protein